MARAVRTTVAALSVFGLAAVLFTGHVAFAATSVQVAPVAPADSPATIIAKAAEVVPSPRQLAWQRLERYNFLHFGVNTFTGREWGTGTENPNVFQPNGLNTDQWATTMKGAGFTGAILTAKHHDGFLLYPSRYSTFDVASTTWAGGQGDVVRSFTDSMHRHGLKVGLYVSPADLREFQPGGKFANGSPSRPVTIPSNAADIVNGVTFNFNSDDYNTYFENTLYELLTRYGTVSEIWLDMANPTGRPQPYHFLDWVTMVRRLQPNAVILNDGGPDVRWIGNEDGFARTAEYSVVPTNGDIATAANNVLPVPGGNSAADVGSDAVLSRRKQDGTSSWNVLRWSPGECNTTLSARRSWFYHPNEPFKDLNQLLEYYYGSVGRNCNMLMNVAPDQRGLLDEPTVAALGQFNTALSQTFGTDLATGATAANDSGTTNTAGHTPDMVRDGNLDSSWQPTGTTGSLVLTLPSAQTFDVISVQEDLNIGQRVRSFAVDSWNGSSWTQIASEPVIGHKRLIRLASQVTTSQVRLRITSSRAAPAIAEIGLFRRPGGGQQNGTIVGGQSGRCIDINGGSTANGARAQLWDCNGGTNQRWAYTANKQLQVYGNKCLDASGQGTTNGTAAIIWDCHGGTNQQWNVNANGTITGVHSGLCLDASGSGTTNGTLLHLWSCHGGANQQWSLRN